VGFGISNKNQVKEVIDAGADGAIVGSAVVKLIENNLGNKEKMLVDVKNFINEMKK
ncbi:TPA: tryptophan synthase subunit alpha, partial [Candidatus Woesearchaeota archaeon]|nr:tryptophan synthase subunit alpha [Candidatus Woesearchaeota archaeon]